MTMQKLLGTTVTIMVIGCSTDVVMPGNAALGIAEFEVTESDDSLEIVGVDAGDSVVGTLELRVGVVTVPDVGTLAGRKITLRMRGREPYVFASGGLEQIYLPAPPDTQLAGFLLDQHVASALATHGVAYAPLDVWSRPSPVVEVGRRFDQLVREHAIDAAREVAYQWCPYQGGSAPGYAYTAPCSGYGASSTCEQYAGWFDDPLWALVPEYTQYVRCNHGTNGLRKCTVPPVSGQPPRSTSCGTAGPAGCAPCGSFTNNNIDSAYCSSSFGGCVWTY